MQQLKIVSIFLVWIWANISLQKSIPECRLSSSGLEACASKCFWNDGSRETVLCKWDLTILGDPSLVFPHDFTHPPPSPNWSLWRSLACERAISISCRVICHLVDWAARTHTREDANKHYEASLFLFDRKPQWTSPPNLTPAFLIKREKGGKKQQKRDISQTITGFCSSICCSGPVWSSSLSLLIAAFSLISLAPQRSSLDQSACLQSFFHLGSPNKLLA